MAEINKKRILTAAFVGGTIFSLVVILLDWLLGRGFSWPRLSFYFIFGVVMYGFLTYRNFKKQNKK
ncbi:hypothetical protein [uncultured Psychroserpens sp.]|uniref:hypothetical protein n=1 Tax=uncultured Psychroserpens sp. TaxID=255436 RepID=UPI002624FDF0|nr:hypothetical protein [uncultured Psychroserpens sp.]